MSSTHRLRSRLALLVGCIALVGALLPADLAIAVSSNCATNVSGVVNGTSSNDIIVCDPPLSGAAVQGLAGDDVITITSGVGSAVRGDTGTRVGGDDTITIAVAAVVDQVVGDNLPANGTVYGDDTITISGSVLDGVFGDLGLATAVGGQDRIVVESGASIVGFEGVGLGGNAVVGDGNSGDGGSDRIIIRRTSTVLGDVKGDGSKGISDGGDDILQIAGIIDGVIGGDVVFGNGGDDIIGILPAGVVEFVKGDAAELNGGRDTITVAGRATLVQGDDTFLDGGNDVIAITNGGVVEVRDASNPAEGGIAGDASYRDGGNDFFIIRGRVEGAVAGDAVHRNGGNDFMRIYPAARLFGSVAGDSSSPGQGFPGGAGGNDTIVAFAGAQIQGPISGDSATTRGGNDRFSIGAQVMKSVIGDAVAAGNGGNDSIGIGGAAVIGQNLIGDLATGNGGKDVMDVSGTINGSIQGDNVDGDGGDDLIYVRSTAQVGTVYGDLALTGNGGDDTIIIQGTVNGNVLGDQVGQVAGADSITVSGTVNGDILPDDNSSSSGVAGDQIDILPAGVVNGNIVANGGGVDVIVIRGRVNGSVFCGAEDTIIVWPTATITGTVCSP